MTTVAELRERVVELGVSKADAKAMKKDALLKAIESLENQEGIFDTDVVDGELELNAPSHIGDPEAWNKHVFSLFHDSELVEGHPKCIGMRRVAEVLFGDIVEHDITPQNIIANGHICVQVKTTLVFQDGKRVCGLADVNDKNTPLPYSNHKSSTADTKSEAKALRRALRVSFYTAEEMATQTEDKSSEALDVDDSNDGQLSTINLMASRNKIDVVKLADTLNADLSKHRGCASVIGELSLIQRKKSKLKNLDELAGFKSDWRDKL